MRTWIVVVVLCAMLAGCERHTSERAQPADIVFTGGTIYTADDSRQIVSALAVRANRIVYAGDDAGVAEIIGEQTSVHALEGAMVLPGLHDMHIHALAIVPPDGCDINSEPMTLAEIAEFVASCIEAEALADGEWLSVTQWSFSNGNQPDDALKTMRQALDLGAPNNPVMLWGNDGHHGAANSLALAQAKNANGETVGISALTLDTDFAEYRETIGVDENGEPNGGINETARDLIQPLEAGLFGSIPDDAVEKVGEVLASRGITSIMDAAMPPSQLALFKPFAERGELGYNLAAALFLTPSDYLADDGSLDTESMIKVLVATRDEYESVPQIRADFGKVFVDGVIEGNPFSDPPTLPNAAVLEAYEQPLLAYDASSDTLEIRGYVDAASRACEESSQAVPAFRAEHGFHPKQCRQSRGVLEHDEYVIHDYMRALDAAGFKIHAHVIGDRALRVALDGFESLESADAARHSLAHIQLVHPDDYQRIGNLGVSLAFTYAWITTDLPYDLTVIPFIDQVEGVRDLYREDGYYFQNAYPVAALQDAGAVLVAGSDAPVDTRDPRPFVNIAQAVTRAGTDGSVLNASHAISILDALDAYTINGARLFGHAQQTGSLEVGKLADLTVVDRDLIHLAETGRAHEISEARVVKTMFEGQWVFEL